MGISAKLVSRGGHMGTAVPAVFLKAAAWAESQPLSDPAARAVQQVLFQLTGPPRIGVCTLDAAVDISIPGAVMVRTTWPAVGSGADVVLLVHPGELSGRVRSRMRFGPQLFVHIEDKDKLSNYTVEISELIKVRERLLIGELQALSRLFPQLTPGILVSRQPVAEIPRVAVIGPDMQAVALLRTQLAPHVELSDSAGVDVVVAVAGPTGFLLVDAPILQDAWHRVGRLVVCSPLPVGVCPGAVPAGSDIVETVLKLARMPIKEQFPQVPSGRWDQVVARWERKDDLEFQEFRLHNDREGVRRRWNIAFPGEPRIATQVLIMAAFAILVTTLLRLDSLPFVLLMVFIHVLNGRRSKVAKWWNQAQKMLQLDITSRTAGDKLGPMKWLRQQRLDSEK